MAETEPHRRFIIKLSLPRSAKREVPPSDHSMDSPCEKRRKVFESAKPIIKGYWVDGKYSRTTVSEEKREEPKMNIMKVVTETKHSEKSLVKESQSVVVGTKDSRRTMKDSVESNCGKKNVSKIQSFEKENLRGGAESRTLTCDVECKEEKKTVTKVVTETKDSRTVKRDSVYSQGSYKKISKIQSFGKENSRGGAESRILINGDDECKKEKKKMERYKKLQCWVILKRMMIGKDGWALKQPIDLNVLGDNINNGNNNSGESKKSSAIGLEDIEAKLKKWVYSKPEEFAQDIRLVFSHALLLYPPRSEIHRIARRLSESFELNWKSLKEKWTLEKRQNGNKNISKRGSVQRVQILIQTKRLPKISSFFNNLFIHKVLSSCSSQ